MKKIYSFTISLTLVLIANTSVAQWTTSGNDVYKTNTLGNVGIGTINPGEKLEVAGTAQFLTGLHRFYLKEGGITPDGGLSGIRVNMAILYSMLKMEEFYF